MLGYFISCKKHTHTHNFYAEYIKMYAIKKNMRKKYEREEKLFLFQKKNF